MNDLMLHFWIVKRCTLLWWHICLLPPPSPITYLQLESPLAPSPQSTLMLTPKPPPTYLHKYIPAPIGRTEQSGCVRTVADSNPHQEKATSLPPLCHHVKFIVEQYVLASSSWCTCTRSLWVCKSSECDNDEKRRSHLKVTHPANPKTVLLYTGKWVLRLNEMHESQAQLETMWL